MAELVKNLPAMWETWVWSWVGKIPWKTAQQPTPVFFPGEPHGQRSLVGYNLWGCKELDMTERHDWATKAKKAMAPHSSTLAWKIPWTEEPGRLKSMGSLGVGHDWETSLSLFTFMHWRRKWQPTQVFLLAWRIPGTGGPGGLPSLRLHRVGHDWSDLAAAAVVL